MPEESTRAFRVLEEALRRPTSERATFLDAVCAGEPSLRAQVISLMHAVERVEDIFTAATVPPEPVRADGAGAGGGDREGDGRARRAGTADVPEGSPGSRIGPYRLLSVLGEGGFGVVFLAERREPMVQRVAIKVIKPGMDTAKVVARFEQERQVLAMMDHPGIARVFDAGTTPGGRPYFVMEFVKGEPITSYCDRNRLTIRERLRLFISVCDAVQHAHNRGVIHRDLKPSNVLVSVVDDKPVPKVIDFGVAKAITHVATAGEVFTQMGQLIGTPEYMSPEQAEMGPTDIDVRTDVYSLGVMLYELLTGALPIEGKTLRRAGMQEIQRLIREAERPRPSTRLSRLSEEAGEQARSIAAARATRIEDLARELRRELDWIPLKALRTDRTERYRSPEELADDIRNYLEGQAVTARPPSAVYTARKFVRRHRGLVAATGAVMVALAVGLGLAAVSWRKELAARVAEKEARLGAERQRDATARLLNFVNSAVVGATAQGEGATKVPIPRETLDDARTMFLDQFGDEPWIRWRLGETFARAYLAAGLPEGALQTLVLAPPPTGDAASGASDAALRAEALFRLRRSTEAVAALQPVAHRVTAGTQVAPEERVTVATIADRLAGALKWNGQLAEARRYYERALELLESVSPPPKRDIWWTRYNLLLVDVAEAAAPGIPESERAQRFSRALASMEVMHSEAMDADGPESETTLSAAVEAAAIELRLGRLDEARAHMQAAVDGMTECLGPRHIRTLSARGRLGQIILKQGQAEEAARLFQGVVRGYRAVIGDGAQDAIFAALWLAAAQDAAGQRAAALETLQETLARSERAGADAKDIDRIKARIAHYSKP